MEGFHIYFCTPIHMHILGLAQVWQIFFVTLVEVECHLHIFSLYLVFVSIRRMASLPFYFFVLLLLLLPAGVTPVCV